VVGVDGAFWQNCANSICPYFVDFALLELVLIFAIFVQVGLVSNLCGQFAS